jgi:hypothetical protein
MFRTLRPARLSLRRPVPTAARAPGLPKASAAGPLMSRTRPAMSSASTTQDMPLVSGRLNDTMTEWAVASPDGDGDGDDYLGDGDADADGFGFGFGSPVWSSTSVAALSVCSRSDCGSGR